MPHSSHRSSRFLNTLTVSAIWPLILVTCSNVAPHVDWRSSFSIPICFFWYRVSTHVLLWHTDSYPVWRNSVGQHLLCLSRCCMSRWDHLAASFSPVKSASVSLVSAHMVIYKNSTRAFQWAINQGSTPPLTSAKLGSNTQICRLSYKFQQYRMKCLLQSFIT